MSAAQKHRQDGARNDDDDRQRTKPQLQKSSVVHPRLHGHKSSNNYRPVSNIRQRLLYVQLWHGNLLRVLRI